MAQFGSALGAAPGFGQDAAKHHDGVEAEVQRRLKKLEKQEDRAMRHAARERAHEVERERAQTDSAASVYFVASCNFILALSLIPPFFGTAWAQKGWKGFGVSIFWLRTGLIWMEVDVECNGKFLEDKICQVAKQVNGVYMLHTGVNIMCAVSNGACQIMNQLFLCSFIIFGTMTLQILMMLTASVMLYNYWMSEPLPHIRRLAVALYVGAPLMGMMGLAIWALLSPDIGHLPHRWTTFSSSITGGLTLFGYSPLYEPYFGWCFWWTLAMDILCVVTLSMWGCFFRKHKLEDQARENELRTRELLENQVVGSDTLLHRGGVGVGPGAPAGSAAPSPSALHPSGGVWT
mmetsp:Transcript_113380/g.325984  ORF Transcript_113380/g.325984 Transcript_113380/m.325984 type:complete len:347 (+) Transcript_113380:240-1280(+)